ECRAQVGVACGPGWGRLASRVCCQAIVARRALLLAWFRHPDGRNSAARASASAELTGLQDGVGPAASGGREEEREPSSSCARASFAMEPFLEPRVRFPSAQA